MAAPRISAGALSLGVAVPTESPDGPVGVDELVQFATTAEQVGFAGAWVGDHVLWTGEVLDALTVLAALAVATKEIALGTSVLLLPLRPTFPTAKACATIDVLSGGRLVLGVGVGGENPDEFEACGVDVHRRGALADRSLPELRRLLAGEPVAGAAIRPAAVQGSRLRILVGGRSPAALRRAGRLGDGWIGLFVQAERFRERWLQVREHARLGGAPADELVPAIQVYVRVDKSAARARSAAKTWLERQFRAPGDRLLRHALLGPPGLVSEGLRRFVEAGARHVILAPTGPDPLRQLDALSNTVVPALMAVSA